MAAPFTLEFVATNFIAPLVIYGNNYIPSLPTSVTILPRIGLHLAVLTLSDLRRRVMHGQTLSRALQGQAAVVTNVAAQAADFVGAAGVANGTRRAADAFQRGRGIAGAYRAAVTPPPPFPVPTPLELGLRVGGLALRVAAERRG